MVPSSLFAVALALLMAAPVRSFWIISHHPLVSQRLDRIVAPAGISSHAHAFVGSAAIQSDQSVDDMCTTSPVKADLSNYWAPQLYYYHGDSATFDSVPLSFVNTYYLNRGGPTMGEDSTLLQPFPKGLKMLAGSASQYDGPLDDSTAANAISFVCLGGSAPQGPTFPDSVCPGGIRTQIVFPSCWDGENLDSSDHQSHVAYPINGNPDTGDCPSTHPVKFMTLFYEFIYNTGSLGPVSNGTSSSGFVLSNGDAEGYSFHADFVSGWDETVLKSAIDTCTGNLFGDLKSCAPFVPSYHEETTTPTSDSMAGYCQTGAAVDEVVLGKGMKSLPGCQEVRNGPFAGAGSCDSDPSDPTIVTPSTSTPTDPNYRGCYLEPTGARALPNAVDVSSGNSAEACSAKCKAAGYSIAGMEYSRECWCSNTLASGAKKVSDDFCSMACTGNATQMCGGSNLLSVYSKSSLATMNSTTSLSAARVSTSSSAARVSTSTSSPAARLSTSTSSSAARVSTSTSSSAARVSTSTSSSAARVSTSSSASQISTSTRAAVSATSTSSRVSVSSKATSSASAPTSTVVKMATSTSSSISSVAARPTIASSASSSAAYVGCYLEASSGRALSKASTSSKTNTPATCAAFCSSKGFAFSGVEYGAECYCGSEINTAKVADSDCSMACAGDAKQLCGAGSRLQVYKDSAWKQTFFTVMQSGQWNFTECVVDSTSKRVLSTGLRTSTSTVDACLTACRARGFTSCGVEYGGECWGGKLTGASYTAAPTGSDGKSDPISRGCSMPCNSNSTIACGGSSRMNLYTFFSNASPTRPVVLG